MSSDTSDGLRTQRQMAGIGREQARSRGTGMSKEDMDCAIERRGSRAHAIFAAIEIGSHHSENRPKAVFLVEDIRTESTLECGNGEQQ